MKFLALIYDAEHTGPEPGSPEFDAYMARWGEVHQVFEQAGVYLGGEALQPSSTSTRVRIRSGKPEKLDGPFAESKEQLGGYYLFECKDMDEALHYAGMIPVEETGTVEVRPVMELEGFS